MWTAACQRVEAEARRDADAQWVAVEKAEAAATELRHENAALNSSARDIETELQREKCDNRAGREVQKFWSDKTQQGRAEHEEALSQQEEAVMRSQLLRRDLDTTRIVKDQYRESEDAMQLIHHA